MIGITRPLTNCALNAESCSSPFCSSKTRCASSCRPKTLTSAWPENVSSMWELSRPVERHCSMNIPCERFMTWAVTTMDTGTDTRAIRASSGEIHSIIASTATTVSTDVSSWLIVCWRVCETLSMSLVARLSSSPRGCRSK